MALGEPTTEEKNRTEHSVRQLGATNKAGNPRPGMEQDRASRGVGHWTARIIGPGTRPDCVPVACES